MIKYEVIVNKHGTKYWYLNGKCHREDGPAVDHACGYKEWYLNGVKLTKEEFNDRMNPKEMTIEQIQEALGHKVKIVE